MPDARSTTSAALPRREAPSPVSGGRFGALGWGSTGLLAVLAPKCGACLLAYFTLASGAGVQLCGETAAFHLFPHGLGLGLASLCALFVAHRLLLKWTRARPNSPSARSTALSAAKPRITSSTTAS